MRDPEVTSRIMSRVGTKDTRPELLLRRRLWQSGFRYRVNYTKLVGRPDIVFVSRRLAIFVDGDFWHGNAWRLRGLASLEDLFPTRTEWWTEKIRKNMERDRSVTRQLLEQGWTVLRFWESTIIRDVDEVVSVIACELKLA
jgi:DNA mismatch endonuclease, patch repair protein